MLSLLGAQSAYDLVQLWSMKNYHYYLKQELYPTAQSGRFSNIIWHPEQPMTLYLVEQSKLKTKDQLTPDCIQARQFVWDTYAAHLPMPNDTASVAVVDGSESSLTAKLINQRTSSSLLSELKIPHRPWHPILSRCRPSRFMWLCRTRPTRSVSSTEMDWSKYGTSTPGYLIAKAPN